MNLKKLFFIFLFVTAAVSAMAQNASVTPYASVRYFIGAYYQNDDMPGGRDIDLTNTLINTSRLGMKFNRGRLSGIAEIGLGPGHAGTVTTRHIYANYKFDTGFELLVGQTDLPWYMPITNEAYDIHGGPGTSQADRTPQIKLSFQGVYIVLAKSPGLNPADSSIGYDKNMYGGQDVYMPLTAIGYDYKSDVIDFGLGLAGYKYIIQNKAEYSENLISGYNNNILAFIAYLHGNVKLGDLFVRFNTALERAPALLGLTQGEPHFNSNMHNGINPDTYKLKDMFVEGMVEVGLRLPLGILAASFGYAQNISNDGDGDANRLGMGIQFAIDAAPNFTVVPTIFYLNELEDTNGNKQGADMLAGIQFRIDL